MITAPRRRLATIGLCAVMVAGCSTIIGIGEIPEPTKGAAGPDTDPVSSSGSAPSANAACDASGCEEQDANSGVDAAPPVFAITTLVPASAYKGATNTVVRVEGTSFAPTATVMSGAQSFVTTFKSATELSFTLPTALLATAGSIPLAVRNGAPGDAAAKTSNMLSFVVSGCDPSGVDVPLGAATTIVTRPTSLASATLTAHSAPTPAGPLAFSPRNCPLGFRSPLVTKYRGFVVQNTTDTTLALSAWTVCTKFADTAYLAFYKRATVPGSDTDLEACTGHSAAGYGPAGAAGYGAPLADNVNLSRYCPGLTVQNGGSIPLAACEKAVVVVEAYDDINSYPAPSDIRFSVDKL